MTTKAPAKKASARVTVTIDGRTSQVENGTTILAAARQMGIAIPTLCHYRGLSPYGACRVCLVEIDTPRGPKLVASCSHPIDAALDVRTDTAAVRDARRTVVELLLAQAPDSTDLAKFAADLGVADTPFEKAKEGKCVLCGLCVRTCASLPKAEAIAFSSRGTGRKVSTPFDLPSLQCLACGACTYVCPTGAIQMEAETVNRLRRLPGLERKCRYMLMGLVSSKLCPNDYDCARCTFDQTMELRLGTHPAFALEESGSDDHPNQDR